MKVVIIGIVWAALAVYSLLCLWTPGLRPNYWRTGKRIGFFGALFLVVFFWFPLLVLVGSAAGLVADDSFPKLWVVFSLLLLVCIVGSWVEFFSD